MSISYILLILRARLRILLWTIGLVCAFVVSISLLLPKTYKASTAVLINYRGIDPVSGAQIPAQVAARYVTTQADIIQSKDVATRVVESLGLADKPEFRQMAGQYSGGNTDLTALIAEKLLKKLDVSPSRESAVISITFKWEDPNLAANIVNAFAEQYLRVSALLKTGPMKEASSYIHEQIKMHRENLAAAQRKLSLFQEKNDILNVDERLDLEMVRLKDLSSQYGAAQGLLMEATARQKQAQENGQGSPEVLANPLIQSLKASLAQAQARHSQVAERFTVNHPEYKRSRAEVEQLRAELSENIASTSSSISNHVTILRSRVNEVSRAIEEQKAKVHQVNLLRDEMDTLSREVEQAKQAYDASAQRMSQATLESNAGLGEAMVMGAASVPTRPAGAGIVLNLGAAVFLGGLLGIVLAILAELLQRRVRAPEDLAQVLQTPVFGVFDTRPSNRRHRISLPRVQLPAPLR